jgi:hypothetical protein
MYGCRILDIEKPLILLASYINYLTWNFLTVLVKLIGSFLSQRKVRVSVEREMSTPRELRAGVPQGSVLSPTLYNMYINGAPQTPGVYLALFADDTCLYATDCTYGFVRRKLQC